MGLSPLTEALPNRSLEVVKDVLSVAQTARRSGEVGSEARETAQRWAVTSSAEVWRSWPEPDRPSLKRSVSLIALQTK